jgi:hypothetical protein
MKNNAPSMKNNNIYNNNKINKFNTVNTYSIVDFPDENKLYGNYQSKSSKSAAHDAFNDIINISNLKNINFKGRFIIFVLRNKENKKEYKYTGTRIELKNPIKINGVEYKYKNIISKYTPDFDKLVQNNKKEFVNHKFTLNKRYN